MNMMTEAVLVLILTSNTTGQLIDAEIVRTFAKSWHCMAFYYQPKYEEHVKQHGIDYWMNHREYATPGYTISFQCKDVGPYYTASL